MDEKIRLLMEELHLKSGQFAQALQINPAMISHILSKRNRPGVELLQRILATYPQVNPDWLMMGRGEMFRALPETSATSTEQSLFTTTPTTATTSEVSTKKEFEEKAPLSDKISSSATALGTTDAGKSVARVILFYTDGTFESFAPKAEHP